MGLISFFKEKISGKPPSRPEPRPAPAESPSGGPQPEPGATAAIPATDEPKGEPRRETEQLGFFDRMGRKVKGFADGYIAEKGDELLTMAERRAEEFRAETMEVVRNHAIELLDVTEKRIDRKLAEVEELLEKRLQQEMRLRLRAMVWTLGFVLLMAIISIVYVMIKRSSGL